MNPQSSIKYIFFRPLRADAYTTIVILAALVGLASGFGAIGFRRLINLFQSIAYGSGDNLVETAQSTAWYLRVIIPAMGGMVVGLLVHFLAREAKGHGVPEVMEAVAMRSGIIRKRVVFVKSLASAVCIGTGGSVGREGPIVQICSAIGSTVAQMAKISADQIRTLVGCGAAAGIAATFNAPIAGAMFALEVILGDFGLATFSPVVISVVTATAVSRHFLGDAPAFTVPAYQLISAWELPLYVIMGLFCSGVALMFTKTLYFFEDIFEKIKIPQYMKACLGGLILGTMGLMVPYILGVGYPAIHLALMNQISWWLMFILVLCKIGATSLTLGSGGSGGIFAPSLFMGAMAGGFFGTVAHYFFPDVTASPGAYAMVGMGAVVSGTTHGPLTAILILFEMTGDYKIILPLMIACIISSLASRQFLGESIYTLKLARRGINIKAGKEINVLKSISVKDVMNPNVETIFEDLNLGELSQKISRSKYKSFPIVDRKNDLTGILTFLDYHDVAFDEDLKDLVVTKELATTKVVTISADDNLYNALEKITSKDFSILPVVSPDNPLHLVGVLTRSRIMDAYNEAVIKKSLFKPRT